MNTTLINNPMKLGANIFRRYQVITFYVLGHFFSRTLYINYPSFSLTYFDIAYFKIGFHPRRQDQDGHRRRLYRSSGENAPMLRQNRGKSIILSRYYFVPITILTHFLNYSGEKCCC